MFILAFIFPTLLWAQEAQNYLNQLQTDAAAGNSMAQLILERINLFELDQRLDRSPSIIADSSTVISVLQDHLLLEYKPYLENILGTCDSGDCLRHTNDGSLLQVKDREICFPNTNCNFYLCMEKKYRCSDVDVHYFTKLAYPTCNAYSQNLQKNKFTQKGVEWIYNVMVCLQKGLVEECEVEGNCSQENQRKICDHITDFTLSFHPGCYINSGVGVCRLPLKDQINIWKTVGPYLTDRERVEAYKVVAYCLKN